MNARNTRLAKIVAWLQAAAPQARLASDSRDVGAGDVFLAFPGDASDGRRHIEAAISNGACAVLFESADFTWNPGWTLPHLGIPGLKQCAGPIAGAHYGLPDEHMFSVAVTGTNGKTSCSQWLGHALSRLGLPTAVVGTLGIGLFRDGRHAGFSSTGFTTPDAVLLQRELARLRDAGAQALAIEASSIGLHQGRLNGTHFDVALFTNLTRDHLDYHGDMASYEAAKRVLFSWPGLRHAVLNLDDPMGLRLADFLVQAKTGVKLIGYSLSAAAVPGVPTLRASELRSSHGGTAFKLESAWGSALVRTRLVGAFNVSNVLGILGALWARGVEFKAALDAVEALVPVAGRMQQLGGADAPLVVIDYAHTPDALEQTLNALREIARQRGGQLWCVFGCGGDRDPGKRPQMGAVAQLADQLVFTSDNPRSEEPGAIIRQMVAGVDGARATQGSLHLLEDRAGAILWAVRRAGKNDVLLLAGKGHEAYQEVKGRKIPFLDADHAALALAARATMKEIN